MFDELLEVVRTLRRKCPWDRKQTVATTRPLLLNEAYELDEALRSGDRSAIVDELGDYLFMGLFLANVLGRERGIRLGEALAVSVRKLRHRHPHVYGRARVKDSDEVLENWEKLKQEKRGKSLLAGLPTALPALQQAHLIQERCRRVGFDWDDPRQVLEKVEEEIGELRRELGRSQKPEVRRQKAKGKKGKVEGEGGGAAGERTREELGDLLFALVNLCRHLGVDAEGTLKDANRKFRRRFEMVEEEFRCQGRDLGAVPLDEMEAAWQRAKRREVRSDGPGVRARKSAGTRKRGTRARRSGGAGQ